VGFQLVLQKDEGGCSSEGPFCSRRSRCMRDDSRNKNEASDLITMKDLLRFHAATGKAMVMENMTCNSLNMFAECFFGRLYLCYRCQDKGDRREVYDVSVFHLLWSGPISLSLVDLTKSCPRKAEWFISRGQNIFLRNAMFVACYEPHGWRTT
jgi:hypothetical protein